MDFGVRGIGYALCCLQRRFLRPAYHMSRKSRHSCMFSRVTLYCHLLAIQSGRRSDQEREATEYCKCINELSFTVSYATVQ